MHKELSAVRGVIQRWTDSVVSQDAQKLARDRLKVLTRLVDTAVQDAPADARCPSVLLLSASASA